MGRWAMHAFAAFGPVQELLIGEIAAGKNWRLSKPPG